MKILLVVGKSNIGKTTVLNMLIEELKKIEYKVNMIEENNVDKVVKCIKGNFSIGINTQGDDFDSVNKVEKIKDCDLIICACRTKGETIDFFVNNYNNENCQVKGKMSQKNLIISPNKKGFFVLLC